MAILGALPDSLQSYNLHGTSLLLSVFLAFWALYLLALGIFRVYLSPISKFPGPKLAALTTWYQAYFDIWLGGQYIWKIKQMHEKYGPVVRINPHELHFSDPNFINEIFAGNTQKRDKYRWTRMLTIPKSTVSTIPHDLHRKRRGALSNYFSKSSVQRLEPIIQEVLKRFLRKLELCRKTGEVFSLAPALKAATADIITTYSFGQSTNYLNEDSDDAPFFSPSEELLSLAHWFLHISWLSSFLAGLPRKIAARLNSDLASLLDMQDVWENQVDQIRRSKDSEAGKNTIFYGLLNSDLPDSEKSNSRLREEAHMLILAGTDTTATTLMNLTFHLLSNPDILRRLKAELEIAIPDPKAPPTCAQVENLPYLTAIIQEGIRLHPGAVFRTQRSCPDKDLIYSDGERSWIIPRNTPMSMTAQLLQTDPDIFQDPYQFRPDRWLKDERLDRYLLAFSKGTRACLGITLAYQELYLMLAGIFRIYNSVESGEKAHILALYDTVRERDVDMAADFVVPVARSGIRGVKITAS